MAKGIDFKLKADLLEIALTNMPHGLCMFDPQTRLVFCNAAYGRLYGLTAELMKPETPLQHILDFRATVGNDPVDITTYFDVTVVAERKGHFASSKIELRDGRTIKLTHNPMADGGYVATHEDVTENIRNNATISHMAHHDALTDLPNRTLFHAQLEQALLWGDRAHHLAVLFIDLDNFKSVNDTLGHPIGDELLKIVADRLQSCIGEGDIVARLGGDEFVIVKTKIEQPTDAAGFATRIREVINTPCEIRGHNVVVDTSIGIALSPSDGTDAEQLVKNADMALYGAKASGRGTYRFFEAQMDERMMARRLLEIDLRKALVNGEFELYYQPLINLDREEICSCEALLRWNHPEKGMIMPDMFIPMAEETGLIVRIGEWVIRTACMEAARWSDKITVAVNISPVQFFKQNLVQVVMSALAASGLPAQRLEIEITETLLIQQTEETLAILNQLHALGVRIAMDDFGTGYSSLSYLQKFPFDKIKIDQSFVQGLTDQADSTAIIRAVTGLAGGLHMTTTAEGVETEAQRKIVTALGCTEMQGYLFSEAKSAGDIAKLFIEQASAVSRAA